MTCPHPSCDGLKPSDKPCIDSTYFLKSRSPSLRPHYKDFFTTMAPSDFSDNLNGISLLAYIHKFCLLPETSHGHVSLSPIHPVSNHTYILLTAFSPNPSPISIKASPFYWRVARYKCHHEFTYVTGWMFASPLFRFYLTVNTLRLATTPEVGTVLIGL